MCPLVHRLRTPCTGHGDRHHLWPCSESLADNSLCPATRSKSSLGCLIRYSGAWPSSAGLCPVNDVRAAWCAYKAVRRSVVNDCADLKLVGHVTVAVSNLGQSAPRPLSRPG